VHVKHYFCNGFGNTTVGACRVQGICRQAEQEGSGKQLHSKCFDLVNRLWDKALLQQWRPQLRKLAFKAQRAWGMQMFS
jgi:hypothetical protein